MKFFDISVPLGGDIPIWPDNPPFRLEPVKTLLAGDPANVSRLVMGSHTGTHVDAPRHFLAEGRTVDELPLDRLVGPCRVAEVEAAGDYALTVADLQRAAGTPPPARLLLKTGNSRLWEQQAFSREYVHLSEAAAAWLAASHVQVIGIDYLSVERFKAAGAPAHHALLGAGVVIIEGLNLARVEPGSYELICLPLRVVGAEGAPARVVLRTMD